MRTLTYTPTEKITVSKPVSRVQYIVEACLNKSVLDLGCFDETALCKMKSGHRLFEEISKVAKYHIGLDNSSLIPEKGIVVSDSERIYRADILKYDYSNALPHEIDLIIAGELIEHLEWTTELFRLMKSHFSGKRMVCTTPNATSLSNVILALANRESTHRDHKQIYSFKTLNSLCINAGFNKWKLKPYFVKYTEMILESKLPYKIVPQIAEKVINVCEYCFPLLSGGLILDIEI